MEPTAETTAPLQNQLRQWGRLLTQSLWSLVSFIVALGLSWHGLASVDFAYPIWHDHAGIAQTIAQYGPLNHYKPGLADTTFAVRYDLFAQIVTAIHQQGQDLQQLAYTHQGQTIALLRPPEVRHLQAVAALVDQADRLWLQSIGLWFGLTVFLLWQRWLPTRRQAWWWLMALLGLLLVPLAWMGFEPLFYALHEQFFAPGHPWFFYYEDSLMTTLMQAPDLFAWIGATLLVVAVVVFTGLTQGFDHLQSQLVDKRPPLMTP